MNRALSEEVLEQFKEDFYDYLKAENAASGSKFDPNANVSVKNIVTAESELLKPLFIQINRSILKDEITKNFNKELANQYELDLKSHLLYTHDETSLKPYCASISMYPLLLNGLTTIGGESRAPKHLSSFCGSLINLVFSVASQFAGAVATTEFLTYFDYFARLSLGEDYVNNLNDPTIRKVVTDHLQQVVYCLNQPAGARGYQAVFWNISIFDKDYFNSLFEGFIFPDGNEPKWESVKILQEFFLAWFNNERTKALLTFPVVTVATLVDKETKKPKNPDFIQNLAKEMSEGNSFFVYMSESADSLASCCRLRNEVVDNTFSYSLGAGGTMTGSINVMTLNLNNLIQTHGVEYFHSALASVISRVHKYQIAYRKYMDNLKEIGALTVYDAGYIDLDKQFLTIGINGLLEAAEFAGFVPDNNAEYRNFVDSTLKVIYDLNREVSKETGYKFNTEFVPAESLGVKNSKWDREKGFLVNRDVYNSYFYRVEDMQISILDKLKLYNRDMVRYLDGGSALHLNLLEHPDQEQWVKIFELAAKEGVQYWTYNVPSTHCKDCFAISKKFSITCPTCGSEHVTHATRIIGYLKEVSSFAAARKAEHSRRAYVTV